MTVRRGAQEPDLRPARPDELVACASIWRVASNDYLERLGQPPIPDDLASITTLYQHLQATDPERFVVATRPDPGAPDGERIIAFTSAVVRGRTWFLSMLFVLPEEQGMGIGRTLVECVLPPADAGIHLGVGIDTAQPISLALYSRFGMVPRLPILHLLGDVIRPDALPSLPEGVTAASFEAIAAGPPDGPGHRELARTVDAIDREILGFDHPQDHRFLRISGRRGFLYRDRDGEVIGYGYGSEVGRFGPVAALRSEHLAPIVGHLMRAIRPRGAYAIWVTSDAADIVTALFAAGFRLPQFADLLCWDLPLADFSRYLPISPGLL